MRPVNRALTTTPPDCFGLNGSLVIPSAKQPRNRSGTPLVSPSMRLWCQLWASLDSEDPRFRQSHLGRNTPLWTTTVITRVIGWGLEKLSYQLTLLYHISVFLAMSVSTRKPPDPIWVLKPITSNSPFCHSAASSLPRHRLISGLVLLVHYLSERFFFILKSL